MFVCQSKSLIITRFFLSRLVADLKFMFFNAWMVLDVHNALMVRKVLYLRSARMVLEVHSDPKDHYLHIALNVRLVPDVRSALMVHTAPYPRSALNVQMVLDVRSVPYRLTV